MNGISKLANEIYRQGTDINSLVIIKDNRVVVEDYNKFHNNNSLHEQFSITKTITTLVIVIVAYNGFFCLDDKVKSFFKNKVPISCSDSIKKLTIRDLVNMSTSRIYIDLYKTDSSKDLIKEFFELQTSYESGIEYKYSNHAAHVLSALINVTTRLTLAKFANNYLFKPLGIKQYKWKTWNDGVSTGASGLYLSTIDLAKIGQVLLNHGMYRSKRIISEDYLEIATTNKYANMQLEFGKCDNDSCNSYYIGDDFGQLLCTITKFNMVIAINSSMKDSQILIEIINNFILDNNSTFTGDIILYNKINMLPIIKPIPTNRNNMNCDIHLGNNNQNISNVNLLCIDNGVCFSSVYYDGHIKSIDFLLDNNIETELIFEKTLQPVILSAYWEYKDKLVLQILYYEIRQMEEYVFVFFHNDSLAKVTFSIYPSNDNLSPVSHKDYFIKPENIVFH